MAGPEITQSQNFSLGSSFPYQKCPLWQCKSWTVEKADLKKWVHLKYGVEASCTIPWTNRKKMSEESDMLRPACSLLPANLTFPSEARGRGQTRRGWLFVMSISGKHLPYNSVPPVSSSGAHFSGPILTSSLPWGITLYSRYCITLFFVPPLPAQGSMW